MYIYIYLVFLFISIKLPNPLLHNIYLYTKMDIPAALRSFRFDLTENDPEFHQIIALQRCLRSVRANEEISRALLLLGRATLGDIDTEDDIGINEALANGRRLLRDIHPSLRGTAAKSFHRYGVHISQTVKKGKYGVSIDVDTKLRNIGRDAVHVEGIRFGTTVLPLSIMLPARKNGWFDIRIGGGGGGEVRIRFSENGEDSNSMRKENQPVTWILR